MYRIIGIDPGISATGLAILAYKNRSFSLLKTLTIKTSSNFEMPNRIFKICELIKQEFQDIKYIGIETSFVNLSNKNYASSIKLANLYGALLYTITRYTSINKSHLIEIPPNKIKKYTTGAGHADKKSISIFLSKIIKNFKINNSHEGDAIAIAYTTGLILTNKIWS